jgi:hypothetical protein
MRKIINKENETNKQPRKIIIVSKIKWENCQAKYWEKKNKIINVQNTQVKQQANVSKKFNFNFNFQHLQ